MKFLRQLDFMRHRASLSSACSFGWTKYSRIAPSWKLNDVRLICITPAAHNHSTSCPSHSHPSRRLVHTVVSTDRSTRKFDPKSDNRDPSKTTQLPAPTMVSTSSNPLLSLQRNMFGGITVNDDSLLADAQEEFQQHLTEALKYWRSVGKNGDTNGNTNGATKNSDNAETTASTLPPLHPATPANVRTIQIYFRPSKCHLMNVASEHGFHFHHANREENYVMMSTWIDPILEERFPRYGDHIVGVGGVVIRSNPNATTSEDSDDPKHAEILLIQERRSRTIQVADKENPGQMKTDKPWKFPGGYVDHGEVIRDAVEREVREETGIRARFQGILGLREMIGEKYGCCGVYVVCVLRADEEKGEGESAKNAETATNSNIVCIQDTDEVTAARWIPLSEITTNEEGSSEYMLFPNSYEFVKALKGALDNDGGSKSMPDLVHQNVLSHSAQVTWNYVQKKDTTLNFYMPSGYTNAGANM